MFNYDPLTGIFTWKMTKHYKAKVGGVAGYLHPKGYWILKFRSIGYAAHRVAWLIVHGVWPEGDLDHQDTDRTNNAILNLRPATIQQNCCNQGARVTNRSGFKGVHLETASGRWVAQTQVNGRRKKLGRFDTAEEAAAAYRAAVEIHHGEFARAA